jgi:MFS-type transporter involved in bile tolerance (Atg22 family)
MAVSGPARRAIIPRLIPKEQLTAGMALNVAASRVVMLLGPALAGVVTAAAGLKTCYLIDALSYGPSIYATARLAGMPPAPDMARPGLRAAVAGLSFIRRTPVLAAAFLTDLDAMLFGLPVALFPALNEAHFGGSPQTLGLLNAAFGVGGLLTAVLSGPAGRASRQGLGMLAGTFFWGAAIAGFGFTRNLPLALLLLAVAGAADTLTVTFRSAMVQAVTPEEFRGRVSAVEYVIGVGGGPLGNFEAGSVAALTSPVISAVSGGIATVTVVLLIAARLPGFTRYEAPASQPLARHDAPAPT